MGDTVVIRSLAVALALTLVSCSSQTASIPLGNWEKEAALVAGSTETPPHSLPKTEYPFDDEGNYMASWAASGERRFGKGSSTYASTSSEDAEAKTAARVTAKEADDGEQD